MGAGFLFDGEDDHIDVPFQATFAPAMLTVDVWVKPLLQVKDSIGQEVIVGQSNGAWQLVTKKGTSGVRVGWFFKATDGEWIELLSKQEIPLGRFVHIAATWDARTLTLFLDGKFDSDLSPGKSPLRSRNCPLQLGGFGSLPKTDNCIGQENQQFFSGIVDEVQIFDVALSEEQIKQL